MLGSGVCFATEPGLFAFGFSAKRFMFIFKR